MSGRRQIGLVSALTLFAFLVAGYHPYVEDGGLYVAGIKYLLDPTLYPKWTGFVTEHLRFSLFAPLVAGVVRVTRLPLGWVLLGLYWMGIWATLYAGWRLVARVTTSVAGRTGGVALLACWLTLPIAGTSLLLMDPYVTARTISAPLVLLAIACALEGAWPWCGLALLAAVAVHPLMAGYGVAAVLVLVALRWRWGLWSLGALTLLFAATIEARAPAESADYIRVAMTRYYWFPFQWAWYEQIGLLAPLAVIWAIGRRQVLARMALGLGLISLAVAFVLARSRMPTHLVARLQPLRSFQIVYVVMILLLGAWLGEHVLKAKPIRWGLLLASLGAVMGLVQGKTFEHSQHVEWPGQRARNGWVRGFEWVRENTPRDALFALDARYITQGAGEDAQAFRAIAERSALADYSKDGGEASIMPTLTEAWVRSQTAQTRLEQEPDQERLRRLSSFGVSWVVLERSSETAWKCDYANEAVKVCRVPSE